MVVTVVAADVPIVGTTTSGTLTLRVWLSNSNLVTAEGTVIEKGDGGVTLPWYTDYSCPVTANIAAQPALTLYSTTDRRNCNDQPQWNGTWLDNGQEVGTYFANYNVPPVTPTSIAALSDYQPPSSLNQRWNYTAYNTDASDARYPQLTDIDTDNLPAVITSSPARLGPSPFWKYGSYARIQTSRLVFSLLNLRPSINLLSGAIFELRTGNGGDIGWTKSGGTLQYEGLLGSAVLLTDPPFGLERQLLFTGDADHASLPTRIVFRNAGDDLTGWTQNILVGSFSEDDWSNATIKASALNLESVNDFGVLFPDQGARIVGAAEDFTCKFAAGAGLSTSLRADTFGYLLS